MCSRLFAPEGCLNPQMGWRGRLSLRPTCNEVYHQHPEAGRHYQWVFVSLSLRLASKRSSPGFTSRIFSSAGGLRGPDSHYVCSCLIYSISLQLLKLSAHQQIHSGQRSRRSALRELLRHDTACNYYLGPIGVFGRTLLEASIVLGLPS